MDNMDDANNQQFDTEEWNNFINNTNEQSEEDNTPGYLNPTIASTLPPYRHLENERVRNSYRTGSCWTVRKLPDKLKVGEVNSVRKEHVVENLLSHANNVFKPTSNKRNGGFAQPTYVSADYDKESNLRKLTIDARRVETETLSRKPFLAGSSRIRSKTEDIFYDPEWKFPNLGPGGGNANIANQLRGDSMGSFEEKFVSESGMINTVKAGPGVKVQEWCKLIHAKISKDWSQYKFRVKFTASNELLIQFLKPDSDGYYPQISGMKTSGATTAPSRTENSNKIDSDPGFSPKSANNNGNSPFDSRPTSSSARLTKTATNQKLNAIFPPPNNILNKYMQHLGTHGLCNQFGFKRRGDRWNIYEVEWADVQPESRATQTGTVPGTDDQQDSSEYLNKEFKAKSRIVAESSSSHSHRDCDASPNNEPVANNRPPMVAKAVSFTGSPFQDNDTSANFPDEAYETDSFQEEHRKIKVMYLTYSFYAPWIQSGYLNTKRVYAHKERKKAKQFGKNFRAKYRTPVDIEEEPVEPNPEPVQPQRKKSVVDGARQIAAMNTFMQGILLHHN